MILKVYFLKNNYGAKWIFNPFFQYKILNILIWLEAKIRAMFLFGWSIKGVHSQWSDNSGLVGGSHNCLCLTGWLYSIWLTLVTDCFARRYIDIKLNVFKKIFRSRNIFLVSLEDNHKYMYLKSVNLIFSSSLNLFGVFHIVRPHNTS